MEKTKKIVLSSVLVLVVIVIVVSSTYAFFRAVVNGTGDSVTGQTFEQSEYGVTATTIYKANNLIPVSEETVDYSVDKDEDICRDDYNRDVCTLIQVDVFGSTETLTLYGFVKTSSSSYTTDNLKFKVYILEGGVFTPVTDVAAVSNLNDGVAHFVKNNVNYAILLPANSTKSLYVAFWINEITASQNADQEKDLNCRIGFEGVGGSQVSVSFAV